MGPCASIWPKRSMDLSQPAQKVRTDLCPKGLLHSTRIVSDPQVWPAEDRWGHCELKPRPKVAGDSWSASTSGGQGANGQRNKS